jgi:DNA mismatch endonuclease (patch repair protein)
MPVANRDWWQRKLERNKERDREADEALATAGWAAIRIWEHEDALEAADRVEQAVRCRTSGSGART